MTFVRSFDRSFVRSFVRLILRLFVGSFALIEKWTVISPNEKGKTETEIETDDDDDGEDNEDDEDDEDGRGGESGWGDGWTNWRHPTDKQTIRRTDCLIQTRRHLFPSQSLLVWERTSNSTRRRRWGRKGRRKRYEGEGEGGGRRRGPRARAFQISPEGLFVIKTFMVVRSKTEKWAKK